MKVGILAEMPHPLCFEFDVELELILIIDIVPGTWQSDWRKGNGGFRASRRLLESKDIYNSGG
jgi:hypothetical protein